MISGVFRISEGGGETPRWWGAGRGLERGLCPSPEKNSFLRPQNNYFGGILTRFLISCKCNNKVQNPFPVSYDLLRVFEDDNTTI